jgi:hypothetical protein
MAMAPVPRPERPAFLPGYGLQSAAHDTTTFAWSDAEQHLNRSRNYWIVSVRASGRPHAMPVWGVWLDGALQFSTDAASVKGRNLLERPEIVAHLESGDDVVILEGRAEVQRDRASLARFVEAYDVKYGIRVDVDNPSFTVFVLRPSLALTWVEKDFPGTATRWRLDGAGA